MMNNTKTTATETGKANPNLFNGRHIEPIGGHYWRCTDCGQQIEAECSCCEPPRCGKCGA
jgi:hypothetical protein